MENLFTTKASTLKNLYGKLKESKIEKYFFFTVTDWKTNKLNILNKIREEFSPSKIVIRSSSIVEDGLEKSMAGCFESLLGIDSENIEQIRKAINNVVNSYKSFSSESSFNEVLIQTQTTEIVLSGVIFTRGLESNSPYYIINYDDATGKTDTVTKGIESKTIKIFKNSDVKSFSKKIIKILNAVREIESLIPNQGLDIEFGMNKQKQIIIFQIRPLTTLKRNEASDKEVFFKLNQLKKEFKKHSKRKNHLAGEKTFFADMPDWNPAEIIGENPHPLDYSLYDYLITNSVWHEARTSQGYYDVFPSKLIFLLGNKPYVDVRSSFNSFIPSSLDFNLREKLVSFYLNKLEKNPELQDKVEFEILYTCYDLSFDKKKAELLKKGFTLLEIEKLKEALLNLTNNLILNFHENMEKDMSSIMQMENSRKKIKQRLSSSEDLVEALLTGAKDLLDDCKKNATPQFSRLARLAFIGRAILNSLISKEIIPLETYDSFMSNIETVAKGLKKDFIRMARCELTRGDFIKKYAHLRPGSYDITSSRYDVNPDFLNSSSKILIKEEISFFQLDDELKKKISSILKKEGMTFDATILFDFTRKSLEARELAKFEFTKNLSDALELLTLAGECMGFSKTELSLLSIHDFFNAINSKREDIANRWKKIIFLRKKEREINDKLELPPIIFSEKDFNLVKSYFPRPNYITNKKIKGDLLVLNFQKKEKLVLKDKILMIENGDPGYDWIFTRNPAGLITKYGGVASHMSIRCAEFGIPAAIGCGDLFDKLKKINSVLLDCNLKKIIPLK